MRKSIVFLGILMTVPALAVIGRFGGSLNTSDPEREFINVKNGSASTALADGDLVVMSTSADDGVTVLLPAGTTGEEIACVVAEAISAGKFGLCQIYGYHAAVKVNGTTFNIAAGGRLAGSTYVGRADGTTSGLSIGRALDASTVQGTVPAWLHLR